MFLVIKKYFLMFENRRKFIKRMHLAHTHTQTHLKQICIDNIFYFVDTF